MGTTPFTGLLHFTPDTYLIVLRAVVNKSLRQHSTKLQLYGHLPLITKTIQARWTRYAGHCWRSRDELISDVLQWTPHMDEQRQEVQLGPIYICADAVFSLEDIPEVMDDKEGWWEIRTDGATSWWWWWWWWCRHQVPFYWSLVWLEQGLNRYPRPLANTLLIDPGSVHYM